ncbi:hypothetical protein ACOME3_007614 [Neoechinorhynchus agilis]
MSETNLASVTLSDAILNVDALADVTESRRSSCFSSHDFGNSSESLAYEVDFNTDFQDRNAYLCVVSKYMEEATHQCELDCLLSRGIEMSKMLYSYRCCSRAIPQINPDDKRTTSVDRTGLYSTTVLVLEPDIQRLFEFHKYIIESVNRFCDEIDRLSKTERRREFVSRSHLSTLGKFINVFATLDELKNTKSSVKNDLSAYKRASQFVKSFVGNDLCGSSESSPQPTPGATYKTQSLSIFLATNNAILNMLVDGLKVIKGFEEVLCEIVTACLSVLNDESYLFPDEKHILVKVIGFTLGLIDQCAALNAQDKPTHIYKLESKKKISLSQIDKMLQRYEVIPLMGDMQIAPFNYVAKSPFFEKRFWPLCLAARDKNDAWNVNQLPSSSSEDDFVSITMELVRIQSLTKLKMLENKFSSEPGWSSIRKLISLETANPVQCSFKMYELAKRALQMLSHLTAKVMELVASKLYHPLKVDDIGMASVCDDYERALKLNLSNEEKTFLCSAIVSIKQLESQFHKLSIDFQEAINRSVYCKLQKFVHETVQDMIDRLKTKRKRDLLCSILVAIRDTCADRLKSSLESGSVNNSVRCVGPSSTALYMTRTMIESVITEKANYGKQSIRRDLNTEFIDALEIFHRELIWFGYLLDFKQSLRKACDLGSLWYREFYLELTMGQRVQFPMDQSLPSILINHSLNQSINEYPIETPLVLLDLYNDAANEAIYGIRRQYLFDEIEAEVENALVQLIERLSIKIFSYYKRSAGCALLGKRHQNELASHNVTFIEPDGSSVKVEHIFNIRDLKILGRNVDVCSLVIDCIHSSFKKSLSTAVSLFERKSFSHILEFSRLIDLNKKCHELMSTHVECLHDFNSLLSEVCSDINTHNAEFGRITDHAINCFKNDIVPNYRFDSSNHCPGQFLHLDRLTTSRILTHNKNYDYNAHDQNSLPEPFIWGSHELACAFKALIEENRNYVCIEHFKCFCRLTGYAGVYAGCRVLQANLIRNMNTTIMNAIRTLRAVYPSGFKTQDQSRVQVSQTG